MRIILREEIDHLGVRGDIVTVSRGYARNFLLPKRLAVEVTDDNIRQIGKERKIYLAKLAEEKVVAEEFATRISAIKLSFHRRVHGEGEELYGSVSLSDVAEALEEKGFAVEKRKIMLSEPIKSVGEFSVSIKLHPEVTASFPVTVEKDASGSAELDEQAASADPTNASAKDEKAT